MVSSENLLMMKIQINSAQDYLFHKKFSKRNRFPSLITWIVGLV
jgi:hypothetical protein